MGLKVFLSYAHDANAALVQRIGRDLEAVGHAPWIDTAEIKSGDDWRRTILDGLEDTDVTLAFLSRHAVREVGVCLDEIALALGVKYGNLATILVEPEQDVQPPVSVSHIQWLDMSGWAAQDDAWYQDRLRAILNLLADPETHRFRGEIEDLESRLHPITQAADIPPLIDGFVGREWVAAAVDTWRRSEPRRRVFRLTGGPGAGKSAFAAWLTHYQRGNVVGLNLCKWNDEDRSDPRRVLRTLAFLLATRLPDYRRRLLDRFRRHDPDGHELDRKGAAAMAHWLLAEPLALIDGGRRRDRCVLLIDALDETLCDNVSELADLLAELAPKLPAWLALLLTSRPDFPVAASLSHIAPFRLDAEGSAANTSDLLDYARRWLATPERTPAAADALIARVVAAAAGNFMYLCRLRAAVDEFGLDLNAPGPLPQGLSGLYRLWFRRQFPDAARYRTETAPLLEVLVAASRPVPVGLLRSMFGWDVPTEARLLDSLGSLFEERPDGVTPFHASLREWLTDRRQSGAEYVVDRARGSRLLADALWLRLVALLATPAGTLPDAFTLAELPMQMAPQDTADQLAHIAAAGGWEPVVGQIGDIVRIMQQEFEWRSALDWLGLLDRLGTAVAGAGWEARRWGYVETGDIWLTIGETDAALLAFGDSHEFASRLAAADPGNAQWQRDLSVSHLKIGDVLSAQGDLPRALDAFRAAMDISARLADADPGNAEWQRDLSISHERIGDVLRAQGDLPRVLDAFRAAMDIRARLADADPGNAQWQRDLSVSHDKIGDVLSAQGDLPARARRVPRRHGHQRPRSPTPTPATPNGSATSRSATNKIGDVRSAQGDLPARARRVSRRHGHPRPPRRRRPRQRPMAARPLGQPRQDRRRAQRAGRSAGARSTRSAPPWTSAPASPTPTPATPNGSATSRSATSGSATCSARRAICRARSTRFALPWTSAPASPTPTPATPNGSATSRSATTRSATCSARRAICRRALDAFRAAMDIRARLADADPGNAQWQRDLSVSHERIGDVLRARAICRRALDAFRAAMAIRARLADADPGNAQWQRDLSISHEQDRRRAQRAGRSAARARRVSRRHGHPRPPRRRRPRQRPMAARPVILVRADRQPVAGPGRYAGCPCRLPGGPPDR